MGHNLKPLFPAVQLLYASLVIGGNHSVSLHHSMFGPSSSRHGPLAGMIIPVAIVGVGAANNVDNSVAVAAQLPPSGWVYSSGGNTYIAQPYASNKNANSVIFGNLNNGNTLSIVRWHF